MKPDKRDALLFAAIWIALTAIGEALAWRLDPFPVRYAVTADITDNAFMVLVRLGIPVFTMVVAVLLVGLLRWRGVEGEDGSAPEDGPPMRGTQQFYFIWIAITGALAVLLIFYPGLSGLRELHHEQAMQDEDLVVNVDAARWAWTITYPDADVTEGNELVLPVNKRVKFVVNSTDILHSFWIPAFRTKIDALPGRTTYTYTTPLKTGSFPADPDLRIQCAELCGFGHAGMAMPVRVVSGADFSKWLDAQKAEQQQAAECEPDGTALHIAAKDIAFDTTCLAAPAGEPFTIALDNQDAGIPHNLSIAKDEGFKDVLFTGDIVTGPATKTYDVEALEAGTYFFRCDVHPILAMSGTFVVKEA